MVPLAPSGRHGFVDFPPKNAMASMPGNGSRTRASGRNAAGGSYAWNRRTAISGGHKSRSGIPVVPNPEVTTRFAWPTWWFP